jgi:hypothetical protein
LERLFTIINHQDVDIFRSKLAGAITLNGALGVAKKKVAEIDENIQAYHFPGLYQARHQKGEG